MSRTSHISVADFSYVCLTNPRMAGARVVFPKMKNFITDGVFCNSISKVCVYVCVCVCVCVCDTRMSLPRHILITQRNIICITHTCAHVPHTLRGPAILSPRCVCARVCDTSRSLMGHTHATDSDVVCITHTQYAHTAYISLTRHPIFEVCVYDCV